MTIVYYCGWIAEGLLLQFDVHLALLMAFYEKIDITRYSGSDVESISKNPSQMLNSTHVKSKEFIVFPQVVLSISVAILKYWSRKKSNKEV